MILYHLKFLLGTKVINDFDINVPLSTVPLLTDPNVSFSGGKITITNATFFIQGQFNLFPHTAIEFNNCHIYMGSGAVIFSANGYNSSFGFGNFVVQSSTDFFGTSCGMWRGIFAPSDGKIYFDKSTISDAEFAVEMDGCIMAINSTNTKFYNNCVSIYAPHRSGASYLIDYPGTANSIFSNTTFDSPTPMNFPTFNGQTCFPVSNQPYAGILVNDLDLNSSSTVTIPF